MKLSQQTLVATVAFTIAIISVGFSGCRTQSFQMPSLAFWKKDKINLASRPNELPPPPSSHFQPDAGMLADQSNTSAAPPERTADLSNGILGAATQGSENLLAAARNGAQTIGNQAKGLGNGASDLASRGLNAGRNAAQNISQGSTGAATRANQNIDLARETVQQRMDRVLGEAAAKKQAAEAEAAALAAAEEAAAAEAAAMEATAEQLKAKADLANIAQPMTPQITPPIQIQPPNMPAVSTTPQAQPVRQPYSVEALGGTTAVLDNGFEPATVAANQFNANAASKVNDFNTAVEQAQQTIADSTNAVAGEPTDGSWKNIKLPLPEFGGNTIAASNPIAQPAKTQPAIAPPSAAAMSSATRDAAAEFRAAMNSAGQNAAEATANVLAPIQSAPKLQPKTLAAKPLKASPNNPLFRPKTAAPVQAATANYDDTHSPLFESNNPAYGTTGASIYQANADANSTRVAQAANNAVSSGDFGSSNNNGYRPTPKPTLKVPGFSKPSTSIPNPEASNGLTPANQLRRDSYNNNFNGFSTPKAAPQPRQNEYPATPHNGYGMKSSNDFTPFGISPAAFDSLQQHGQTNTVNQAGNDSSFAPSRVAQAADFQPSAPSSSGYTPGSVTNLETLRR